MEAPTIAGSSSASVSQAQTHTHKRPLDNSSNILSPEQNAQLNSQVLCYRILLKNGRIPDVLLDSATKKIDVSQVEQSITTSSPAPGETSDLARDKRIKREKEKVESCLNQLKHEESASVNHAELYNALARDLEKIRGEPENNVRSDHLLQELLEIGMLDTSPLKNFPPSLNENIYVSIVELCLKSAPDTVKLLINLLVPKELPIDHSHIMKLAYVVSLVVKSTNEKNCAMAKLKSVILKTDGLTNEGLDKFSELGVCENARILRYTKTLLAGVSEEKLKRACKKSVQHTLDNMDLRINETENHLTVTFVEVEKTETSHLSTERKTYQEKLAYFSPEEILLTSSKNIDLKKHFENVVTVTIGKIIAEALPEYKWMLKSLPRHHEHLQSNTSCIRSEIHTLKPLYLQESKNRDMIDIVVSLQNNFLDIVSENCDDKNKFRECLAKARIVTTPDERKEAKKAEDYIHETIDKFGEFIGHGDLLTEERWNVAHRLRRNSATAEENLDYVPNFYLGMFHAEMAKVIQDITSLMKELVNIEDVLTLGWFRCYLGLSSISNEPNVIKRSGNYEDHAQFLEVIGKECIVEAFRSLAPSCAPINSESSLENIRRFIFEVLLKAGIRLHFNDPEEKAPVEFDHVLSYSQNLASRTIISLVLTTLEHEGDATGLRAVRKLLIPYMLNRKQVQSSKYAVWLTRDEVNYASSSERTKARIDLLACANPSGEIGKCIHRDKLNEHIIRKCKNNLKGMHSSLEDLRVEKTIMSMDVCNQIVDHDRLSMLMPLSGGGTSYRQFSKDDVSDIRREYRKVQPFSTNREKIFYKNEPTASVYSGLTMEDFMRFLKRNREKFAKECPHK